jgi:alkanesulfonate monooxygenase SsuD/methylene tetrahydromethanopterin reductase-like flavin-dependent oxidoreductase (luciferase family)
MSLRTFDDIGAAARRYEELGYDYLTCGEHVSFHSPMPNSLISLSLDVASRGRLTLGVGVGGEYPPEFEACGVPVAERGARTNEALEILTRLWPGERVSFEGKFTRFSDIAIKPPPTQRPHPPIWVSGRSAAAMRRAARFGDAWMPYMFTPDMVAESGAQVQAWAGRPVRSALLIFFCVHGEAHTARAMAAEALSKQYGQDFSRLVDRYALAGTPEEVISQVRRFTDAGVSALMVASACPASYLHDNLALFTAEVLPALREF